MNAIVFIERMQVSQGNANSFVTRDMQVARGTHSLRKQVFGDHMHDDASFSWERNSFVSECMFSGTSIVL